MRAVKASLATPLNLGLSNWKALAGANGTSRRASGWARKSRAVEDQSAPIPEDMTNKLGGNIIGTWFLDARGEGQSGHKLWRNEGLRTLL